MKPTSNEELLDLYFYTRSLTLDGCGESARKAEKELPIYEKEVLRRMNKNEKA